MPQVRQAPVRVLQAGPVRQRAPRRERCDHGSGEPRHRERHPVSAYRCTECGGTIRRMFGRDWGHNPLCLKPTETVEVGLRGNVPLRPPAFPIAPRPPVLFNLTTAAVRIPIPEHPGWTRWGSDVVTSRVGSGFDYKCGRCGQRVLEFSRTGGDRHMCIDGAVPRFVVTGHTVEQAVCELMKASGPGRRADITGASPQKDQPAEPGRWPEFPGWAGVFLRRALPWIVGASLAWSVCA